MIFYDFEVFEFDWLGVFLNTSDQSETIIINDTDKLTNFYEANKHDIWTGFNNVRYDQFILKGILLGLNPKRISDFIIQDNKPGWSYTKQFNKIYSIQYDVMNSLDKGLKLYEGFQGLNIKESDVAFNISRALTDEEIEETVEYCRYDVLQTFNLFNQTADDFNAHLELVKMACEGNRLDLTLLGRTKVQLGSIILDARSNNYYDEWDFYFPEELEINKYIEVLEWYKNPINRSYKILDSNGSEVANELNVLVAGVPHVFRYGGLHGARDKYHGEGHFLLMDVASLYPSLMIEYDLLSRSCSKQGRERYKKIYKERLKLKHEGKKKEQAPLKLVLNGSYGAMKDHNNPLYDPLMANLVCIYGQLFLLDLIEIIEPHCEIIQSNTDGILVKLNSADDYYKLDDLCYEWEKRTRLKLEFEEYVKVFQKDVNNYILVDEKGDYTSVGGYVKKLNPLDNDLPIVNKALINYFLKGISLEETINNCDDLMMFQQIDRISSKFSYAMHGSKVLKERTIRSFASLNSPDGALVKIHGSTGRTHKLSNTSNNCFIDNSDVRNKKVPAKLDRQHYINLARKRLEDFGVPTGGETFWVIEGQKKKYYQQVGIL